MQIIHESPLVFIAVIYEYHTFLFAAICKLCRVLLSSPDLIPRTQKTETVADEPLAEEPSLPDESTGSEIVSRREKPYIHK